MENNIQLQLRIGTPSELRIKKSIYIPAIRKIFSENSEFKRYPLISFLYEWLQFKEDLIQLVIDEKQRVCGFFGSPIKLPLFLFKLIITLKKNEINQDALILIKESIHLNNVCTYINSSLFIAEKYRNQGMATFLKKSLEKNLCHKKFNTQKSSSKKIILISIFDENNLASAKIQRKLGYIHFCNYFSKKHKTIFTIYFKQL
jgi:hypothetical protein